MRKAIALTICGDGEYTRLVQGLMEEEFSARKVLLTTSCTAALEMSAVMSQLQPGDEVIMPSYTFVTTANAFVLVGAVPVFVDIRPDTMNIDEFLIEAAITERTKAIVPVHYAGVSCELDKIMDIAQRHGLLVIEDAAQGVMSRYKGRFLGTIADIGCYSFHETKNYTMGEGGAILVNNSSYVEEAETVWEKGTNRRRFLAGQVDKYTWVSKGSSYLPSELNAAYLYPQLLERDEINASRLASWHLYYRQLSPLRDRGLLALPTIPPECEHNAHMFYIKVKDIGERTELIRFLKERGIQAVFHYVPLHTSPAGREYCRFNGEDRYTTAESEKLLRLPMYYGLTPEDVNAVTAAISEFFGSV